ncbi:hypothetical protein OYT88_12580 [Sporolactobacillus sp. CQH2019]|nr:hypothetical protein [Sporolactobacillus sp. CQH2019]MDD9149378.1 hypothetical protein [Sporolactobacillus sp. CQH2019]
MARKHALFLTCATLNMYFNNVQVVVGYFSLLFATGFEPSLGVLNKQIL